MNSLIGSLVETLDNEEGDVTPESLAHAQLTHRYWEDTLSSEFEAISEALQSTCFTRELYEDKPLAEHTAMLRKLEKAWKPFHQAEEKSKTPKPVLPAPAPTATPPATTSTTTARAFVVKDYVSTVFTAEGDPSDILGGYREWESAWRDAATHLDEAKGVTNPIRLLKLQQSLGGEALKLIRHIPTETEDGYSLALKKLADRYNDPVGLATAIYRDSLKEKRSRAHEEARDHLKSLRKDMEAVGVDLEEFYHLYNVLEGLSAREKASWERYVVSLRTRYTSDQVQVDAAAKKVWQVGMAHNIATFSNWREEWSLDLPQAEETGVHLAGGSGPRYSRSSAPSSSRAGCAYHGWTAPHTTASCQAIKKMDSTVWARTVVDSRACYKCGEFFGRGHKCDFAPCEECRSPHHPTFRCAHHKGDEAAYRAVRAEHRQPGTSTGRKHSAEPSPFYAAPKRARGKTPTGKPGGAARKRSSSPPHKSAGRGKGRGKRSGPGEGQKRHSKE